MGAAAVPTAPAGPAAASAAAAVEWRATSGLAALAVRRAARAGTDVCPRMGHPQQKAWVAAAAAAPQCPRQHPLAVAGSK